ncbi:MAG: hypothetical protein DRP87_04650 [Spirochaetes bacterium]|nr:MAG: hypothetical protein DRP87_04650 [Spirochaetota bacterium]
MIKKVQKQEPRAWVVTVNMGLGHQRAAYPLRGIAEGRIITIGDDKSAYPEEKKLWNRLRKSYETISRMKKIPLVGKPIFGLLDYIQNIPPLYPVRNMSNPTMAVHLVNSVVKKGIGRRMMEKIREKPLPLVTSYPIPAIAADRAGYSRIYAILCDAEISRAWVAENPTDSRIHYFAPCGKTVQRLKTYGVPDERIFLTGFPMPTELTGSRGLEILKRDLGQRLFYLDPNGRFWALHKRNVVYFLGRQNCKPKKERILSLTYAVGGAGVQKEIGFQIARALREKVLKGEIKLNLVAGIREEVKEYFDNVKQELLPNHEGIEVIYSSDVGEYFERFNQVLRYTDILWTKPSELSFYCGLGFPVIIAPPIGAHERYNKKWLMEIQAGIPQEDPQYADQWLLDLLWEGRLAESAWDGFLKARKFGTYKILEILETGTMERETSPLKR